MMTDLTTYLPITDPTWIFFIVLSIILFAPMLLERLKIPSIVGMIAAGILIGPHGFICSNATAVSSFSARWDSTTSCFSPRWR